jgi:hypothetical protein
MPIIDPMFKVLLTTLHTFYFRYFKDARGSLVTYGLLSHGAVIDKIARRRAVMSITISA